MGAGSEVALAAAVGLKGYSLVSGAKSKKKEAQRKMRQLREQAKAKEKELLQNAEILERNRVVAMSNIKRLGKTEFDTIQQSRRERDKIISSQEAAVNGLGFSLNSGTASAIKKQTMYENSLDNKALREAFSSGRLNLQTQAKNYQIARDRLINQAASVSVINNNYSVGGAGMLQNILTGGASMASDILLSQVGGG